jgi:NADH-quinone oxidoreductase subunit E
VPLPEEIRTQAREIVARYPAGRSRSALLPMLHLVQSEQGYVSAEGVTLCAEELGLTKAEVGAVATFYTMYKRKPAGEYLVSVCTNLSCQILGGDEVFARLSDHLDIGHNETTADGSITLEHAECLAACDFAPVVTVNYEFYDNATPDSAVGLVRELQSGGRPEPTRGAPLCTFKEIERQLAGFVDPRPSAVRTGRSHPDAPAPVDSRGTVTLTEQNAPKANAEGATGEYAVPGAEPERTLSNEKAADTWAEGGAADAGASPSTPAAEPAAQARKPRSSKRKDA